MTTATSSRSTGTSRSRQQRSRQTRQSKSSTPQQRTSGGTSTSKQESTTRSRARESHGTTVELPFVTAEFHRPDMHLPTGEDVASAARSVQSQLPSREQTLFYGALTLGAAFAVIEWPVALAIGVGTALAQHESSKHDSSSE